MKYGVISIGSIISIVYMLIQGVDFYKITVLNVLCGSVSISSLIYLWRNYSKLTKGEGWGSIAVASMIIIAGLGLTIDLAIQHFAFTFLALGPTDISNIIGLCCLLLIMKFVYDTRIYDSRFR